MALVESNMFPLGTRAPDFSLPEPLTGKTLSLGDVAGSKGTVVMFICNHCPFVKHVIDGIVQLGNDYRERGIGFVAISSNDVDAFPDDSPEAMAAWAREKSMGFPYLYDETQAVAKAYDAACTPDFYLFDANLECVYRGRMDEARPKTDVPVSGCDLRAALDALLAGGPIPAEQYPSMGCNIKWKE